MDTRIVPAIGPVNATSVIRIARKIQDTNPAIGAECRGKANNVEKRNQLVVFTPSD